MQSCAQASRPPSRPGGRFRHRAHFAVTRGALSRLAPSCESTPQSGPRSARQRRFFAQLFAGPSGARNLGVRHLRDLGHAPPSTDNKERVVPPNKDNPRYRR
ncbi:hypothetical protein NDU88_010916 [Pleurodeles waltl]|uniref:Uncharacterized protein n=1 Tax=Pleurodeles waltl TaxID=8319 RepID=A0AAV7PZD7_PLEWA|nr:hypothetical protein NDU88_010916 [Pleurodeles waltl]